MSCSSLKVGLASKMAVAPSAPSCRFAVSIISAARAASAGSCATWSKTEAGKAAANGARRRDVVNFMMSVLSVRNTADLSWEKKLERRATITWNIYKPHSAYFAPAYRRPGAPREWLQSMRRRRVQKGSVALHG